MRIILSFLLYAIYAHGVCATTYRTEPHTDKIKSLLVNPVESWDGVPIIKLGSEHGIEIRFDEMSHEYKTLTYSVLHCNADWTRSDLSPIEYLKGFQNMHIADYLSSFNTTMPYTNYRIVFPNENTDFKVSGNYAVQVFDSDHNEKPLLTACFSVEETPTVSIAANISGNTDIDFNRGHQQVSFSVNCKNYRITSPQQELKVFLTQNNRGDNRISLIQPTSILNDVYTYRHNRQLIFEAGNEFRRFETVSTAYNGMGVDRVTYYSPYFHISLQRDLSRSKKAYIYDEDQNGRFLPHCVNCENYDIEADYLFVHFTLNAPEPYLGRVYILSEAFNNITDARSEMQYNFEEKAYTKTTLLKQGAYNYLYLLQENKLGKGLTAPIEGNYFETENEYLIWVYYRALGDRYDRLIGTSALRTQ